MKYYFLSFLIIYLAFSTSCNEAPTPAPEPIDITNAEGFTPVEVVTDLNRPWGITFLDAETFLITERNGALQYVKNGEKKAIVLPININASGQGGLLDIEISSDYAQNAYIYMTYAKRINATESTTALVRFKLNTNQEVIDFQEIFEAKPYYENSLHYGARIAFDESGHIFISLGDRYAYSSASEIADPTKAFPQDLATHWGKIIRLNLDGTVPSDNPFVSQTSAMPEIYSYGHRNPQGIFYDKNQKRLYIHEHGAQGGDEVNLIESGKNYGWPVISYGKDYNDKAIGVGTSQDGMEQPLHYWDPSIAPSSMIIYQGARYENLIGSMLITTLRNETLHQLIWNGNALSQENRLLEKQFGRLRDVAVSPDDFLYILIDSRDGKVIRLDL